MNSDFYTHMLARQRSIELYERAAQDRLAKEARRAAKEQRARQRSIEDLRAAYEGRRPRHGVLGAIREFFAGTQTETAPQPGPVDRFLHPEQAPESEPTKPTADTH
ncbi:hypothetical protein FOE78_20540 [Microlunatus elymi]|uniref:Uncharacterized protein n=1 Tax=Microlunatus elymi TaxID=2596828 RepID=A0A516Q3G6_9ACTN|nr:hypothetical protein [Microlunatus elymi]QDP97970.1 hypothetical protein FOE78_20540 [Microlunatus elymi]